ncbi:MAG: hypothetical protein HZB14_02200 [Actinobacteria bacterium]|nr:hypothetical protein [Actinomycetota bacterium]
MSIFNRRRGRGLTELTVEKPGPKRRMLLVVNPYASTVSDRLKNVVIYALQSRYEVEAIETRERNHATEIVRSALERDFEVICAFGGDGTANEVVNGMVASEHSRDVPFTFLPGGMTNVIGRNLGLPEDIIDATEHLLSLADHFEPRRVDLGTANGRAFLFGAGAGLDADIVKRCEARPQLKKMFGQNWYLGAAVGTFTGNYMLRRARLEVEVIDSAGEMQVSKAVVAVAQNSRPFTYFRNRQIDLAPSAGLDTGALSLTTLDRGNPIDFPPIATRLLSQKLAVSDNRHVRVFDDCARATIRRRKSDGPQIPLQVDGDYIGDFDEIEFKALPGALSILA